ncbi:MAG TPA: DUF4835 family protein [Bacteroidota bacterium]|nr:DUF4835 family protein [Bacteroidota bacterium]
MRPPLIVMTVIIAVVCFAETALGQIEAQVTVNLDQIQGSTRDILSNFGPDVQRYINSNRWSSEDIGNEKIQISLSISLTATATANVYDAQVFLGSSRPVYKSEKKSAMLRLFDDSWEFTYVKNQPLVHDETRFDPLTSFINFYMYLVLGYDFDSYSPPLSGTQYFQRAITICGQAPSGTKGWDRSTTTYSKYSFIEELLNSKYEPLREGMFTYNYRGIDYLIVKPDAAYKNIITFIQNVADFKRSVDPNSLILKAFFDAKYQELAETFRNYQDKSILQLLSSTDPSHQSTYMGLK